MNFRRPRKTIRLPRGNLVLGERTLVMGILNVTPDSFSDGGLFTGVDEAVERALQMEREGADMIDVGAESTRPGSERITGDAELERLLPVLQRLAGRVKVPIAVDTYKPAVAEPAFAAGASIINFPVLSPIRAMAELAARLAAPLVAMHVRGTPADMANLPLLEGVTAYVLDGLRDLRDQAFAAGLPEDMLLLDPGFGFGKNRDENFRMLAELDQLHQLGCPLLVGTSRKSFIGHILNLPPDERVLGTAATVTAAILAGAHVVRVHDVAPMVQAARIADAILNASEGT